MSIRRDVLIGLAALVALQLLTSIAAIGVLARMSPAIERILEENEYSIDAAEQMLAVLASTRGTSADPPARARYAAAQERLRQNVTEGEERAPIAELDRLAGGALDGEAAAVERSVEALGRLVAVNRAAMRRVDAEAQRLGRTGAWAAVLLACLGFLLSQLVARRLSRRLLMPLLELSRVTQAARSGQPHRRCQLQEGAPDVRRILESVNDLLDARMEARVGQARDSPAERAAHAALLHLLDQRGEAGFVLDRDGGVAAASRRGLEALAAAGGEDLRRALHAVTDGRPPGWPGLEATPLGDAGYLCALTPPSGAAPEAG